MIPGTDLHQFDVYNDGYFANLPLTYVDGVIVKIAILRMDYEQLVELVGDDRSTSYMFDVEETFGRFTLYLDHLYMNLSEYLSQAITYDMDVLVSKKIGPPKKRTSTTDGVEARNSTTQGVKARTITKDNGKEKYESDDDSDYQSDKSVDYLSPGEDELIKLRNRMKANRKAKAKAKDKPDEKINEPNEENSMPADNVRGETFEEHDIYMNELLKSLKTADKDGITEDPFISVEKHVERYPMYDETTHWRLRKPKEKHMNFNVGEKYTSVAQFKECLTYYALANGFSLWYERSGEVRVVAKCGQRPPRMFAPEKVDCKIFGDKIRANPEIRLCDIADLVMKKYKCKVSLNQCTNAEKYALTEYEKSIGEHYSMLRAQNRGKGLVLMLQMKNSPRRKKRSNENKNSSSSNKKPKLECWKCGKTGHFKRDCRSGKKNNANTGGSGKGSKDQSQDQGCLAIAWWIDSSATTHVCKDRCWFKTFEPVEDGSVLYMGDEHFAPIHGTGSVALEFSSGKIVTLFNVFCFNSSLWHARFKDVHYKRMLEMSKDDLIPAIDENPGKCIIHETTAPYTPQQNGVAERKNRALKEMVNSMLSYSGLSEGFWGEAMLTACYLLNRVPNKRNKTTPYELWYKKRPNLSYLRVWGCRAVVRLTDPKRKTLGEKGIDCIFVGYAEHSKAYRFYVIEPNDSVSINSIIESRDAIFDENRFSSIPRPKDIIPNVQESQMDDHTDDVPNEIPEPRRGKRAKKAKSYGSDFQLYLVEGSRDQVGSQYSYCYSIEEDPRTYNEAMQSRDAAFWKEAIDDEIGSIMENNTWVLSDLPPGCKPLGCKWIFKRKMKVDGTIDKFKARLVIQGFRQKEGIDYFDTYAPVARITTIRLLLALASIYNLVIHQMDVKTAFLNGDLDEEVYMKQPEGFVMPGNEHKVRLIVTSNQVDRHWKAITRVFKYLECMGVFLLGVRCQSWASKRSKHCITSSTMESEFVALAAAVRNKSAKKLDS
ncbi:zinc finger, CCHC-type containing protein [Tanacetum coccineum]